MRASGRRIDAQQFIEERLLLISIEHIAGFDGAETSGLRSQLVAQNIPVERAVSIVFLY